MVIIGSSCNLKASELITMALEDDFDFNWDLASRSPNSSDYCNMCRDMLHHLKSSYNLKNVISEAESKLPTCSVDR